MRRPLELCTICGSFLYIGDIKARLDEHNSGRQHAGYAKIRQTLAGIHVSLSSLLIVLCVY
jgi:hypothetical protein